MNRNLTRAVPAHLGMLFALVLAGCDGGGDSPVPPPPPPPAPEAAYVVAAVMGTADAQGAAHYAVRVFDPANPGAELLHDDVELSEGTSGVNIVESDETAWDPDTRTVTTLGHARAFYTNHGQLWAIDLRGGHDHAPQRIGNAEGVCGPDFAYTLSRDGQDAWVTLGKSQGGLCPPGALVVRTGGSGAGTQAPGYPSSLFTPVPVESADGRFGGALGVAVAPDGLSQTTWFADAATMHWTQIGAASDTTNQFFPSIVADPAQPATGWLALPGGILAASWDDAGLTVGAQVVAAAFPTSLVVADGVLHYVDGADFRALDGSGSSHSIATAPAGSVFGAVRQATSGFVLGRQPAPDSSNVEGGVGFVANGDATFTELSLAGFRLEQPLGGRGDATLLSSLDLTDGHTVYARHVAPATIESLPRAALVVDAPSHVVGARAEVVGTFQCELTHVGSFGDFSECGAGTVSQVDLVSGVATVLGDMPAGAQFFPEGRLTQGVMTVLLVGTSTTAGDLFLVVPGQANSLVRLTTGGH